MDYAEVLRRRRMVRRFDAERPVPPDVLRRVVHSGLRAPSAGFSQGWDFVVLADPTDVAAYWSLTTDDDGDDDEGSGEGEGGGDDAWLAGVRRAPVLVLCCSDKNAYLERYAEPDKGWTDRDEARWPVPYWDVDTGMAALLMLLTAVDEGLGALFFGVPPEYHDSVDEQFGIPRDRDLVGVVALGYEDLLAAAGTAAASAPDAESTSSEGSARSVPAVSGSARTRRRRPAREVVHVGRFGAGVDL